MVLRAAALEGDDVTTAFATVLAGGELMPTAIAIDDVPAPWTLAIRRAAALPSYLAYRATWVSRDKLLYLFWPDASEEVTSPKPPTEEGSLPSSCCAGSCKLGSSNPCCWITHRRTQS